VSLLGLTISEEKNIPKKFGIFGMDLNSVGIPGFRRPKFPRNSFGIPVERTPKQSELCVPKQEKSFLNSISYQDAKEKLEIRDPIREKGFGIQIRAKLLRNTRNSMSNIYILLDLTEDQESIYVVHDFT